MNLVYKHTSGGCLWQGDEEDVEHLSKSPDQNITVIALMAREIQPDLPDTYRTLRGSLLDDPVMGPKELLFTKKSADRISDELADQIRQGVSVLSSCAMGWNRSGIVSALTLMKLDGQNPEDAVDAVRRARSSMALSNPLFVKILHGMKDCIGSKSAWTNWDSSSS